MCLHEALALEGAMPWYVGQEFSSSFHPGILTRQMYINSEKALLQEVEYRSFMFVLTSEKYSLRND